MALPFRAFCMRTHHGRIMSNKLWGGRFRKPIAPEFERFSESYSFDRRLALAEIRGSRAHARGLGRSGILTPEETSALITALDRLETGLRAEGGVPAPAPSAAMEDVHTWVFQKLEELAGAAAKKLQTGRSRNEQVALDLRLYLLDHQPALLGGLGRLIGNLAHFAAAHADVLTPGYTHLQRAQPVSAGHHALAYAEKFLRDADRLRDTFRRMNVLPLGSGALAGTPLPVDREEMARELGFAAVSQNSLDAVSDRDFALELTFALSLLGVHLSRLAEDWILYSSSEFGWLVMGDEYSTGSSLMPQKKNADALELIRGKSARQVGNLTRLLVLLKGLPMAYNRDMQEDKEAVFDALDTALGCIEIAAGVVETVSVNRERAAECADDPALLATDLADLLVEAGVAFHSAHGIVGRIIATSVEEVRDYRTFSEAELKRFAPELDQAKVAALTAALSVSRRSNIGGTAVVQVQQQAQRVLKLAAELAG